MKFNSDVEAVDSLKKVYTEIHQEISKVIIGQDKIVNQILVSIFSDGHALLTGVPGLAKTMLVNTISQVLNLDYKRIQFTPDLMPSDIIGTEILNEEKKFRFIKGPLFANIVLADEINRTPPKTQAALLEAMQERRITNAGVDYELDRPFLVLATQNPIEQEGTYPLPEAQLDRFMFNVILDYPSLEDEIKIVKATTSDKKVQLKHIIGAKEIVEFQRIIRRVPVSDSVTSYAVKLSVKTRPNTEHAHDYANKYLEWGAGPRASQYLILAAKTNAVLKGKYSPDIEDVKEIALPVLRHRIVKNYKADAEGVTVQQIIEKLVNDDS